MSNGYTRGFTPAAPGAGTQNIGPRPKFRVLCTMPGSDEPFIRTYAPRADQSPRTMAQEEGLVFHDAERLWQ